jgi:hypothetical protein
MKVTNGTVVIDELKLAGVALPDNVVSIDTHIAINEIVQITYTCNADVDTLMALNRGLARLSNIKDKG